MSQKIFIVQGRHPTDDGNPMSAFASYAGANREANSLTNIILHDLGFRQIPPDADTEARDLALETCRTKSINGGTDMDVWITELELEA